MTVTRKVDSSRNVSFAGANYHVGNAHRLRQVQVAIVGEHVEILERHAPDEVTRRIAHLTRQDEARHEAFALGHLERHMSIEPDLRGRLAYAAELRHHALRDTA